MNYTPGPWKVSRKAPSNVVAKDLIVAYCQGHEKTETGYTMKDAEANARLIAAAPELLEACKYAIENLKPKGTVSKDFSGHNAMATLSRAIAKAEEGES